MLGGVGAREALGSDYLLKDLGAIVRSNNPTSVRPVPISNTMIVVGNSESAGISLPWVWLPHERWFIPAPPPQAGCGLIGFTLNFTELAGLSAGYLGIARDVNDGGYVVGGQVIDEFGDPRPFAWQLSNDTQSTGTVDSQRFPIDNHSGGIANGLNEEVVPEIVGQYTNNCLGGLRDGFRTRWGFSTTTILPMPLGYEYAAPVEITTPPVPPNPQQRWARGTASLNCSTPQCDPGTDPASWRIDQSSVTLLPEPFDMTQSGVHHMNESLDTVGWVTNVGGLPLVCLRRAAAWIEEPGNGQPVDLHAMLPTTALQSEAFGVANRDTGLIELVGADTQTPDAYRWRRSGLVWSAVNLDTVTSFDETCATYDITIARDVNDCGWIVAEADRTFEGNTERRAVVLRPMVSCPADLDRDGLVGPADLAILLGLWGTDLSCDSYIGDLDFDFDVIGAQDLAVLLGAWGGCVSALTGGAPEGAEALETATAASEATAWNAAMDAAAVAAGFLSFDDFKSAVTTQLSSEDAAAACELFATYAGGGL